MTTSDRTKLLRQTIHTHLADYHAARRRCDWARQATAKRKELSNVIRDAARQLGERVPVELGGGFLPETEVFLVCGTYEARLASDSVCLREAVSRKLLYLAFGPEVWVFENGGGWVVEFERRLYGTSEE